MAKPFPDPNNLFKWFIEHEEVDSQTAKPTGDRVTSYFRYEEDFERGINRYVSGLISYGIYDDSGEINE